MMKEPILENIEWVDSWVPQARATDVMRLLACGDSICRSYYPVLRDGCMPGMVCSRYATSRYAANPDYRDDLSRMLQRHNYAIITFNCGLHGWAYDEDTYAQDLAEFVGFLEQTAPQARLIWLQTTPLRTQGDLSVLRPPTGEYRVGNDRVAERNVRAQKIMDQKGIPVCDLYTPLLDRPDLYNADATHFNEAGTAFLGQTIVNFIKTVMPGN